MSDYELEIFRESNRAFLRIFRHPSEAPEIIRALYAGTRDYYAARDAVDLERAQIIRLLSYSRRLALTMGGSSLFFTFLFLIAMVTRTRAHQWTPEDFNWTALSVHTPPQEEWRGLYVNLTEHPVEEHAALRQLGRSDWIEGHEFIFLSFLAGMSFRTAISVVTTIVGIGTAIDGCVTSDGSANGNIQCVLGIAGTIAGLGLSYKSASTAVKGWLGIGANVWDGSGLESIALDVFSKRSQELEQIMHEMVMRELLRRSFGSDPELLGYVPQGHHLAGRDDEHLHAEAPVYRFLHPRNGLMDVAARRHINGTRFTISYAGKAASGNTKRQSFQHERLSSEVFMARFDEEASMADPSNPSFDALDGYQQLEDTISCFVGQNGNTWPANGVVDMQMYDTSSQSTFGWVTMGIVDQDTSGTEAGVEAIAPAGMPLAIPTC